MEVENQDYIPAKPLIVVLQPENKTIEIPRKSGKTVQRLLEFLHIKPCTAIVVRDNILLTPDLALYAGDTLIIRKIQSSG